MCKSIIKIPHLLFQLSCWMIFLVTVSIFLPSRMFQFSYLNISIFLPECFNFRTWMFQFSYSNVSIFLQNVLSFLPKCCNIFTEFLTKCFNFPTEFLTKRFNFYYRIVPSIESLPTPERSDKQLVDQVDGEVGSAAESRKQDQVKMSRCQLKITLAIILWDAPIHTWDTAQLNLYSTTERVKHNATLNDVECH